MVTDSFWAVLSLIYSKVWCSSKRADWECECKVGERPTAFLMDTPGVMLPNVPNEEVGMRLAITGTLPTPASKQTSSLLLNPAWLRLVSFYCSSGTQAFGMEL